MVLQEPFPALIGSKLLYVIFEKYLFIVVVFVALQR